jgi:Transport and Golgi organisation 2
VCSVVVRWSRDEPTRILALRDELVGRAFDDPGQWWPEFPNVAGGRDRTAGGTWCASRIDTEATALVLNRPQKRLADPGAPSRGVLPLVAVMHGADWPAHVDLAGMASFALVLAAPHGVTVWVFDGHDLSVAEQPEGTVLVTSGGSEDRRADRYLAGFAAADYPTGWRELVQACPPSDDPAALVIRREHEGSVFATVFGQLIQAEPGRVRLEYSREPWQRGTWTSLSLS